MASIHEMASLESRAGRISRNERDDYLALIENARASHDDAARARMFWEAIGLSPNRLEAVYELMMLHHAKGEHARAAAIGALAPASPEPPLQGWSAVHDYLFAINYSVSCHYAGDHERAYRVGSELLLARKFPPGEEAKIVENLRYFTGRLPAPVRPNPQVPALIVVDDFLKEPDAVRRFALAQDFQVSGNYPGLRTGTFATEVHRRRFEDIIGRRISYFPAGYNGSFQIVTRELNSWIHRDETRYGGVLFLTPDPPPASGTLFYRHRATGMTKAPTKDDEHRLNQDANDESKWDVIDRVGNKYNRLVLFDGFLSHRSDEYFGTDKASGRLFQTFFFDVEAC